MAVVPNSNSVNTIVFVFVFFCVVGQFVSPDPTIIGKSRSFEFLLHARGEKEVCSRWAWTHSLQDYATITSTITSRPLHPPYPATYCRTLSLSKIYNRTVAKTAQIVYLVKPTDITDGTHYLRLYGWWQEEQMAGEARLQIGHLGRVGQTYLMPHMLTHRIMRQQINGSLLSYAYSYFALLKVS